MGRNIRIAFAALALLAAAHPALADIPPTPRPGPRPAGPADAVVRGLSVEQVSARGTRDGWAINIVACAPSQAGCQGVDLTRTSRFCSVTAVDGRAIRGGDVAALVAAVNAAGPQAVRLTLNGCRANEITLKP